MAYRTHHPIQDPYRDHTGPSQQQEHIDRVKPAFFSPFNIELPATGMSRLLLLIMLLIMEGL